jgi:hypothetical protein
MSSQPCLFDSLHPPPTLTPPHPPSRPRLPYVTLFPGCLVDSSPGDGRNFLSWLRMQVVLVRHYTRTQSLSAILFCSSHIRFRVARRRQLGACRSSITWLTLRFRRQPHLRNHICLMQPLGPSRGLLLHLHRRLRRQHQLRHRDYGLRHVFRNCVRSPSRASTLTCNPSTDFWSSGPVILVTCCLFKHDFCCNVTRSLAPRILILIGGDELFSSALRVISQVYYISRRFKPMYSNCAAVPPPNEHYSIPGPSEAIRRR